MPRLPNLSMHRKPKEGYDYSADVDYENCKHGRAKVFEVTPLWEIDKVSIILNCPDCERVGEVDGRLKYDDSDINWG